MFGKLSSKLAYISPVLACSSAFAYPIHDTGSVSIKNCLEPVLTSPGQCLTFTFSDDREHNFIILFGESDSSAWTWQNLLVYSFQPELPEPSDHTGELRPVQVVKYLQRYCEGIQLSECFQQHLADPQVQHKLIAAPQPEKQRFARQLSISSNATEATNSTDSSESALHKHLGSYGLYYIVGGPLITAACCLVSGLIVGAKWLGGSSSVSQRTYQVNEGTSPPHSPGITERSHSFAFSRTRSSAGDTNMPDTRHSADNPPGAGAAQHSRPNVAPGGNSAVVHRNRLHNIDHAEAPSPYSSVERPPEQRPGGHTPGLQYDGEVSSIAPSDSVSQAAQQAFMPRSSTAEENFQRNLHIRSGAAPTVRVTPRSVVSVHQYPNTASAYAGGSASSAVQSHSAGMMEQTESDTQHPTPLPGVTIVSAQHSPYVNIALFSEPAQHGANPVAAPGQPGMLFMPSAYVHEGDSENTIHSYTPEASNPPSRRSVIYFHTDHKDDATETEL